MRHKSVKFLGAKTFTNKATSILYTPTPTPKNKVEKKKKKKKKLFYTENNGKLIHNSVVNTAANGELQWIAVIKLIITNTCVWPLTDLGYERGWGETVGHALGQQRGFYVASPSSLDS